MKDIYKGVLIMLLGAISPLLGLKVVSFLKENDYSSGIVSLVMWFFIVMMGGLMLYGASRMRCPNCNKIVAGHYRNTCPKCKTNVWK